jgi:hypothetical protein
MSRPIPPALEGRVLEIWSRIVEPYRVVARELGYELLETLRMGWESSYTCIDAFYRDGTYLDLSGSIVLDGHPAGVAPGFGGAQFRTFTRSAGKIREIMTVGIPDPLPRAFGLNAWIAQNVFLPLLKFIAEENRGVPMKSPAVLAEVDRRHAGRVGDAMPLVGEDPLELRWSWQQEIEDQVQDYV